MVTTSAWRWERVLLLLAVLFGVIAMHAAVAPVSHTMAGMPSVVSSVMPGSDTATSVVPRAGISMSTHHMPGPAPAAHRMLHLCLAVLATVIQLGLALVGLLILARRPRTPSCRVPRVVSLAPRPPPPSAVRLAQLCVLRN